MLFDATLGIRRAGASQSLGNQPFDVQGATLSTGDLLEPNPFAG